MVNINWGTKIAVLYISFVAMIGFMVTLCLKQNVELVTEDYYERELAFQDKINEMNNANALPESVSHLILPEGVQIKLPTLFKNKKVNGEILFFRPADKSKDYSTPIQLNSAAEQVIDAKHLSKGMYKMKISWSANDISYFTEEIIVIP